MHYFISYSRAGAEDNRLAQMLKSVLSSAGHEVFLDMNMTVGTDWSVEIGRQLDRCEAFIVLLSERSIASDMVCGEVHAAYSRQRQGGVPRILPVRVRYRGQRLGYQLDSILGRLQCLFWDSDDDTGSLLGQILCSANDAATPTSSASPDQPAQSNGGGREVPAATKAIQKPAQVADGRGGGFAVNIGSARDIDFGSRRPR